MSKRERLQSYLRGEGLDRYVPAAFFLHFGDAFRSGRAAIERHAEFFKFTGMDFAKIQFELGFPGVEIGRVADFEKIPSLPLEYYAPQLEVVEGLVSVLKPEAMVVCTLYSPFMVACQTAGADAVSEYFRTEPEPVVEAIERITDSLLGFAHHCADLGLDGFYHSTQGGEAERLDSPESFLKFVKPTDLRLMNGIAEVCEFNILHICDYHAEYGGYDDLSPFLDYPGTVVNVSTEIGGRSLTPAELAGFFGRPFMGGLDRKGPLATGTADQAAEAAGLALADAPEHFILGADCTVGGDTPWENLRAAIAVAHGDGLR